MTPRASGFIAAGAFLLVSLATLLSMLRLSESQVALNRLEMLVYRSELRETLARVENSLFMHGSTDIEGMRVSRLPAQSTFNVAGLFDRFGPTGPVFLDEGQIAVFLRLADLCQLESLQIENTIAWLRDRPAAQGTLPIDVLVTVGLLDPSESDRLWQCFRYDPPIHRTRILEIQPRVLSAWVDIDLNRASELIKRLNRKSDYFPEAAKAELLSSIRELRGEASELSELGFSGSQSLRRFVLFYRESPFALWTVGDVGSGVSAVLSRRVFWYPRG